MKKTIKVSPAMKKLSASIIKTATKLEKMLVQMDVLRDKESAAGVKAKSAKQTTRKQTKKALTKKPAKKAKSRRKSTKK